MLSSYKVNCAESASSNNFKFGRTLSLPYAALRLHCWLFGRAKWQFFHTTLMNWAVEFRVHSFYWYSHPATGNICIPIQRGWWLKPVTGKIPGTPLQIPPSVSRIVLFGISRDKTSEKLKRMLIAKNYIIPYIICRITGVECQLFRLLEKIKQSFFGVSSPKRNRAIGVPVEIDEFTELHSQYQRGRTLRPRKKHVYTGREQILTLYRQHWPATDNVFDDSGSKDAFCGTQASGIYQRASNRRSAGRTILLTSIKRLPSWKNQRANQTQNAERNGRQALFAQYIGKHRTRRKKNTKYWTECNFKLIVKSKPLYIHNTYYYFCFIISIVKILQKWETATELILLIFIYRSEYRL